MKTYFEWHEPKSFTRKRYKEGAKILSKLSWRRTMFEIIFASSLLLSWYIATKDPEKTPPSFWVALLMAFGLAFSIFHVIIPLIIMLYGYVGREIKVTDKKIIRKSISGDSMSLYKNIQSFELKQEQLEDITIDVLVLYSFKGRVLLAVGLAPEISVEQLETFLSEKIVHGRVKTCK